MSPQDRQPDADAAPLSDDERAAFDSIAAAVTPSGISGRWSSARHKFSLGSVTFAPAIASIVALIVLVIACVFVMPYSTAAAALVWLAAVVLCVYMLPRWKAALSDMYSKAQDTVKGR